MKSVHPLSWLVLASVVLFSGSAFAFTPPPLEGYVVDTAGKLSDDDKRDINDELSGIKEAGGPWMAVLITSSLQGESIEEVGLDTARAWKIGDTSDNGVVIVVAPNERKIRIEVGKHLEGDLTDLEANDIIRQKIGPRLAMDDFRGGIEDGAQSIFATVTSHGDNGISLGNHGTKPAPVKPRKNEEDGSLVQMIFLLLLGVVISISILFKRKVGGGWTVNGGSSGGDWGSGGGLTGGGWGSGGGSSGGSDSGPSGGGDFGGGGSSDSY